LRHNPSTLVRILRNATVLLLGFMFLMSSSSSRAQAQTTYALTQAGAFGTLNLTNGAFNQITAPGFEPAGMAGLGGNLYAANYPGSTLYQVNLTNGNFTTVGNAAISYYDFGGTTTALYGVDTNSNLYSVNQTTGAATLIGATGLGTGGFQSLSSGGAGLYTVAQPGSTALLYSVNTTTGLATEIGDTGIVDISGMGFVNGQLYAGDETGNLYTINVNTAASTLITNNGLAIWGIGLPALTYSVLHNFTGGRDGSNPFAGLTRDTAGNLYGTAGAGGTGECSYDNLTGCGTVFKLTHVNGAWTFNPLYEFQGGTDGEFPARPITIGPNASLYGATIGGGEGSCSFDGATGCGIVYNIVPPISFPRSPLTPWTEKLLYRFTGGSDGGIGFTSLIFDHAGNIYGTTVNGGANGFGTVFELAPAGGGNYTESVLYSFAGGSDGQNPPDGLIADTAGNFYGTTSSGGGSSNCTDGCGTVFELSPNGSGWTEKVLYRFQGTTDGKNPDAGVAIDSAGNLYGNTWQGGSGGGGTVYQLMPSGGNWTFNLLYSVPVAGFAVGRVALDSHGNVYNALQNGGTYNDGQIFELAPSNGSWIYTDLYDFTGGSDGSNAIGGVLLDSSGNIYGNTLFGGGNTCGGGSYGCGDVWELAP
jgi:uncharacterized repeat protein (TIGR03803 family)